MELLEKILGRDNLNEAYKRVYANKGASGVDGVTVEELLQYLKENKAKLLESVRNRTYKPQPVRRVEIPKENGKKRQLGIPTVVDRVLQQAVMQVLSPIYEEQFSNSSYGFRVGRSCEMAIMRSLEILNEGYDWVIDIDLERFFDTVHHDRLMNIVNRTIKDGDVISLIRKFLVSGVMVGNKYEETDIGTPQGGNLSPLLANIMLNELDKELEARGLNFARYADDCNIFVKSEKAAERVMKSITDFIERKLGLIVNATKSKKGLDYIEIHGPRAQNQLRPIYLNNNMQNCYKRNHTGDYKCSLKEMRAMVRDQVDNIDAKVLDNFSFDDFSSDSITAYRNMFKSLKENHVWNKLSDIEFLEKIRALEFVDEVPRPTVAGLLFFGYDYRIMSHYPLYFLDYQEKMSDNINVRYTNRIHTGTGDSSGNIFDFYSRVVGRLLLDIELPFKLKENSIQRESESKMHVAVREALANCLTNADFTFPRGLVIKKTYTQMIFENPGSLRVSVEQAFKGGISDPRNSLILHMFNQIGIGEKAGSGIPTINQAFEENGFVAPVLYEEFSPNRTFLKLSFEKKEVRKEIATDISIEKTYENLNH